MVRFEIPEDAHYSEKFLACRRPDSPYPRERRVPCLKRIAENLKSHFQRRCKHSNDAVPTPGNGKKGTGFYEFPDFGTEDDERHDSVQERRSWDDILEWMHREAVNIVGVKMSEEERRECVDRRSRGERCGCLGPLGR